MDLISKEASNYGRIYKSTLQVFGAVDPEVDRLEVTVSGNLPKFWSLGFYIYFTRSKYPPNTSKMLNLSTKGFSVFFQMQRMQPGHFALSTYFYFLFYANNTEMKD